MSGFVRPIICTSFGLRGECLHQAAPRRWFGPATCIVWEDQQRRKTDPRAMPVECRLRTYPVPPKPPGKQ